MLSWPGWLIFTWRFTHISGHPSAEGRACDQDRRSCHCATPPTMMMILLCACRQSSYPSPVISSSFSGWRQSGCRRVHQSRQQTRTHSLTPYRVVSYFVTSTLQIHWLVIIRYAAEMCSCVFYKETVDHSIKVIKTHEFCEIWKSFGTHAICRLQIWAPVIYAMCNCILML